MANKKYKVLIVDDDQFISDMYVLKFKEAGFEAAAATEGMAALKPVKKKSGVFIKFGREKRHWKGTGPGGDWLYCQSAPYAVRSGG